ncbi:unnamed protein product [Effrenium voratum]|nr:unnamed protein product [Effrenium voratum]
MGDCEKNFPRRGMSKARESGHDSCVSRIWGSGMCFSCRSSSGCPPKWRPGSATRRRQAWSGGVDFSFQISPHEAELVASPGPLVVVGRSGSGKTLCCLERIWLTHRKWVYISRQGDGAESELPRQVFVTLSPALAENVRSNFERRAVASGLPGAVPGVVEEDLPDSLGETPQESFPLFVTFAKLMRMLDASIGGTPFFPRLPCGKIDSNLVTFTTTGRFQTGGIARDHLQEIDFNIFRQHIMRTMKRTSLTAEVLWREIQTFIKGHRLVIETEHGYLSEVQYFTEIGKKMNWAMDGREEEAYALFRQYEIHKKRLGGFDRMDLAVDLLRRLGRHGYHGPRLDDTCVDEAQDLSQVEAVLIMQVVKSPENLIFVGDTCQTVSTETDFRFQDLISCFTQVLEEQPPKLKSLLINYRSHDGIVQAANKIVKLLEILYPKTIDRLDPAMGQNRGPQPERIGLEGLRRIFRELSRSSSRCLLGAHQMILVRTEEAKRQLREVADMEIGNVITMDQLGTLMNEVEAKGLEFDDVIVARFFQDSQYSEWSRLMRRAAAGRDKHHVFENQDGLACMELKRFYVAMTRAKKRLLFYDDSSSATAVIEHLGDTMGQMTEEAVQELAARAQQQQTSEQWDQRGCDFMRAQNFKQALQCFHLSGNVQGVQRCEAFLMRQEAEAKDDLGLWRQAGQLFQALGENREAADCFLKAGEMATAATLFLAVGRFKDAAGAWLEGGNFIQAGMLFASQLQSARKAAQCVVVMCDICWKQPRSAELTTEWLKQSGRKQGYEALCELRRKDPDEIKEQEYKRGPASMELVAEATRVAQEGGPAIKGQVACCWRQVGLHKEAAELWRAAATESEELTASRDFFMKAGEAFVSFGQQDDAVACFENAGYRGHIRAAEELSGTGSLQRAVDQYEQALDCPDCPDCGNAKILEKAANCYLQLGGTLGSVTVHAITLPSLCQRGDPELGRAADLFKKAHKWPMAAEAYAKLQRWADAAVCEEKSGVARADKAAELWEKAGKLACAARCYHKRQPTREKAAELWLSLGRWDDAALSLAYCRPQEALELCQQHGVKGWPLAKAYEALAMFVEAGDEVLETLWAELPEAKSSLEELLRGHRQKMSEHGKNTVAYARCREVADRFIGWAQSKGYDQPDDAFPMLSELSQAQVLDEALGLSRIDTEELRVKGWGKILEAAIGHAFALAKKEKDPKRRRGFVKQWHGCWHFDAAWDVLLKEGLLDELIVRADALKKGDLGESPGLLGPASLCSLSGDHRMAARFMKEQLTCIDGKKLDDKVLNLWKACLKQEQWLLQIPPEGCWGWIAGSYWEKSMGERCADTRNYPSGCSPLIAAKAFQRMDAQKREIDMGLQIASSLFRMLKTFRSEWYTEEKPPKVRWHLPQNRNQLAGILWIEHQIPSLRCPWLFLPKDLRLDFLDGDGGWRLDLRCPVECALVPASLGCPASSSRPGWWQVLGLEEVRIEALQDFLHGSLARTLSTHLGLLSSLSTGHERAQVVSLYRELLELHQPRLNPEYRTKEVEDSMFAQLRRLYDDELQNDLQWKSASRLAHNFKKEFKALALQLVKERPRPGDTERWARIFRMLALSNCKPKCKIEDWDIPEIRPQLWHHCPKLSESDRKCILQALETALCCDRLVARCLMRLGWLQELVHFWQQHGRSDFAAAVLAISGRPASEVVQALKDCQAESPLSQHDDLSQWIWEKQLQAGIRPETEDPIWQLAFALDCGDSAVQQLACQAVPLEEADNQGLTDADLRWLRGCQLMAESLPRLETGLGPEVLQAGCRRIAKAAHILQKSKPPKSCPHEEQGATLAPYLCLLQKCYATFHPATLERKYLATFFADITFTLDKGLHAQGQRFQECHGLWHLELPELQREVTESLSWVFAALQKALLEIAGHNLQLCCWSHCRSSRFPWQSENVHSLRQSAAAQIYCQLRNGWDGARSFREWFRESVTQLLEGDVTSLKSDFECLAQASRSRGGPLQRELLDSTGDYVRLMLTADRTANLLSQVERRLLGVSEQANPRRPPSSFPGLRLKSDAATSGPDSGGVGRASW